jgi:hypothetical protein
MAVKTMSGALISAPTLYASAIGGRTNRRRRIDFQARRARKILEHAIEYLIDEFKHETARFSVREEKLEAVLLLMALKRVFFGCPLEPTFGERCGFFLRLFFG